MLLMLSFQLLRSTVRLKHACFGFGLKITKTTFPIEVTFHPKGTLFLTIFITIWTALISS
jgi:hypothetical protein